jgi:hypothetical protein
MRLGALATIGRRAMFRKISLMAAILATVVAPVTDALASHTDSHHRGYHVGYHPGTYHRGYRTDHHRNYGVHHYHPVYVVGPAAARPTPWPDLGSVIYGYPYGTPCYRYNDRDWDYEWVC